MITTLQAPLTFVSARRSIAPLRERFPFPDTVGGTEPPPRQSLRPSASSWRADADPRASEVVEAFRRTGGLVSGEELTLVLRRRTSQPISMLARWIVERRVVSFGLRGEYLVPMFQFEGPTWPCGAASRPVLAELKGVFDDWDLATWFALPNDWLGGHAPRPRAADRPARSAAGGSRRPLHRAGLTVRLVFSPTLCAKSCNSLSKENR
jgi:hypothetical protein